MKSFKSSGKIGLGIVLLLAGLLFLAGNLEIIPGYIYDIIVSWPMILIAIALINFIHRDFVTGVIILTIGLYFLLPKIAPDLDLDNVWKFWPLLLIIAGISIITRRSRTNFNVDISLNKKDTINDISVFGGNVTRVDSQNFKGGKITSIFGGSEVNLSDAILSENGAVIELTAVFGGTKIIVPGDWHIKNEVTGILGGFTDNRTSVSKNINYSKTLLIKGTAIFGGGELSGY